ncbi:MAG: ribosome recycling factor [Chlamydiia bacterium]|nr:ribosome recycling factor [Chlamydiia bacterium]
MQETKKKMEDAIDHLKHEMSGVRTGQANPAMLDSVMVEVYGTRMRIKELATVTSPEARQLLITPFDTNNTPSIGKAIEKANLGFMPVIDANAVRINVPPMDEALRKEMVKVLHRKLEDCKVSIRNVRREANDEVKQKKSSGEITEDDLKRMEKQIQDFTDQFCKKAEEMVAAKEKEVITV